MFTSRNKINFHFADCWLHVVGDAFMYSVFMTRAEMRLFVRFLERINPLVTDRRESHFFQLKDGQRITVDNYENKTLHIGFGKFQGSEVAMFYIRLDERLALATKLRESLLGF
jgi:hypothetical protein